MGIADAVELTTVVPLMAKSKQNLSPRILNRKAKHDYHILEKLEVGVELIGSEVKSIRHGRVSLGEGFARVERNGELYLYDVDIGAYVNAPVTAHEPKRKRKLLAHRKEIERLGGLTSSKGVTLIPLAMYFNSRGICKLELGVAQGKAKGDKRESLKKKEADKDMRRAMTRRRIG